MLAGRFERGDLVRVAGRVDRFRDQLQIELRTIAKAEGTDADPAAFLPVAYRDMEELDGFLEHLAREVYDPAFRGLLDTLLADDDLRAAWRRAPCTRAGHHAYLGGLLEHTVAVATLAAGDVPAARQAQLRPAAHRGDRPRPRAHRASSPTAPRSG